MFNVFMSDQDNVIQRLHKKSKTNFLDWVVLSYSLFFYSFYNNDFIKWMNYRRWEHLSSWYTVSVDSRRNGRRSRCILVFKINSFFWKIKNVNFVTHLFVFNNNSRVPWITSINTIEQRSNSLRNINSLSMRDRKSGDLWFLAWLA